MKRGFMKKNMFKNLFCLISDSLNSLVNDIFNLFGAGECDNDHVFMQSGDIIVTGKDHIEIKLKRFPSYVKVVFKDHCVIVPCNHQNFDHLEWEVFQNDDGCIKLHISWHVTGVREISWHAYF